MKKLVKLVLLSGLALSSQFAFATPVNIADGYLGQTNSGLNNMQDVFGGTGYKVEGMDVDINFVTGYLTIDINTYYADGDGPIDGNGNVTHNGDLFISTDGWNPYSTAGDCNGAGQCYSHDDATNGEDWEYGVVSTTGALMTGFNTVLASDAYGFNAREDQEVLVGTGGTNVGNATVDTSNQNQDINNATLGTIRYTILLSDLGLTAQDDFTLGFHWSMTCGNDVIEGGVSSSTATRPPGSEVSEPSILALLGLGLLIPAFRRRRLLQQA